MDTTLQNSHKIHFLKISARVSAQLIWLQVLTKPIKCCNSGVKDSDYLFKKVERRSEILSGSDGDQNPQSWFWPVCVCVSGEPYLCFIVALFIRLRGLSRDLCPLTLILCQSVDGVFELLQCPLPPLTEHLQQIGGHLQTHTHHVTFKHPHLQTSTKRTILCSFLQFLFGVE